MRRQIFVNAIVIGFFIVAAGCGDDGPTNTGPTSSVAPSSTVVTTTTTSPEPTTTEPSQSEVAIWPFAKGERYSTPDAAVRAFAVEYLGYTDPALGAFEAGDGRSGEIEVRAGVGLAAFTTVLVRRFADDTWWVLGAMTPEIASTSPEAGATISSPVTLEGTSRAFEANVNVEIHIAGSIEAIVTGFVMGGGMEDLEPYSKAFAFESPEADFGVIVLRVLSMKDGGAESATIVPVQFG